MIKLTIIVTNVDVYIGMAFTHVRIYISTTETGTYVHLVDLPLVAGQTEYSYTHSAGTADTWYKSSIYDSINDEECCFSDPVKGVSPALFHYATYGVECEFSATDDIIIRKIRRLIGDFVDLDRLYIDGTDEYTLSSALQPDGYTVDIGQKGWPVYISVNDIEKTSLNDPIVQGYQYLTFSGTIGSTDKINVWFYTFKFSDREVYEAYSDSQMPAMINSSTINQDMLILQSAIDLLENMWNQDIENGAVVRDDQSVYDPSIMLRTRADVINGLKKQLDNLVRQYIMTGVTGILID
jgi:hypothetical protein